MKKQYFLTTLLGDVSIGAGGSLTGGLAGKDYLPGLMFLGFAAKKLYPQLTQEEAWQVFHQGGVRFGDALPLSKDQQLGFPMPLSWHKDKEDAGSDDDSMDPQKIYNMVHNAPDNIQPRQLRTGYVTHSGLHLKLETRFRMKTALEPETGRAADGRLFGYSSIDRGARFLFTLAGDDGVDEVLFQGVAAALKGEALLGRSKNAEYGHVRISSLESPYETEPAASKASSQDLLIWCLSDMAVENHLGQPVTLPHDPQWLGLPSGDLIQEKSFIKWRREAPFNGKYRAHELERILISRGSVLCYRLDNPKLAPQGSGYLGLYQQAGLGWVVYNPLLLENAHPQFVDPPPEMDQAPPPKPTHPLASWLVGRQENENQDRAIRLEAETWAEELRKLYITAHMYAGAEPDVLIGPSASQWGRVRAVAREATNVKELKGNLFNGGEAVCKKADPAWCQSVEFEALHKPGSDPPTFFQWLDHRIKTAEEKNQGNIPATLALLARHAMAIVRATVKGECHE